MWIFIPQNTYSALWSFQLVLIAVSKKPDTKRWNICGISTETKPLNFPWNFHREFQRHKSVKFLVEFPQKVPQRQICGNNDCLVASPAQMTTGEHSCAVWKFHRKLHGFISVEFPRGISSEKSTDLFLWNILWKFRGFVSGSTFCVGLLGYCRA